MNADCPELERFVRGEIDPEGFAHREHIRMEFEMLRRYDFASSASLYSNALKVMLAKIGKPHVFHQTVTIAFLALIAERIELNSSEDFEVFADANPDLFDQAVLRRWYSAEQLGTQAARRTFVLPELAQ